MSAKSKQLTDTEKVLACYFGRKWVERRRAKRIERQEEREQERSRREMLSFLASLGF